MTNTNLPDHWTPAELVGAPAHLHRAAKDYAEAYALAALAALAQSGQGEAVPLCYMVERHAFRASPHGQDAEGHEWVEVAQNENEPGAFPVYTRPQPAQAPEAQPARVVDRRYLVRARWPDGIEAYLTVAGFTDLGQGVVGIDVEAPEGHPLTDTKYAAAPTPSQAAVTELVDGKWYWVRYEGFGKTYEAPALFKSDAEAFYSHEFSGVPAREVHIIGEALAAYAKKAGA